MELKKFLKEAEVAGDVQYIGKLNMHIAGCYFDLGNRVKILPYALKAVNIFENSDNRSLLARSYNILGIAYHAQDLTYEYVINGTDSYEGHLDFEKISKQEVRFGEYERAQRFADILIKYAEENGHTLDQIISKRVQANISYAVGEEKRALNSIGS